MRVQLHGAAASTEVGMYATSCIAHCQSIENEHPEALWHWEGRWGINASTAGLPKGETRFPRETFGDWYFGREGGGEEVLGESVAPHTVEQLCDWGPTCNPLCPMYT